MELIRQMKIHVQCQKDKTFDFRSDHMEHRNGKTEWQFSQEDAQGMVTLTDVPGGFAGRLSLKLLSQPLEENRNLAMEHPVTVELYVKEQPEKITAMYLFNDWWTRPAFIDSFSQIPPRTQIAFLKYPDRYACLVPAVGESFKAYLAAGGENWFTLELTAALGGQSSLDEPLFLWIEDMSIYGTVEKAFDYLARKHSIRKRQDRSLPEMFRYLGWCSWDAFYTEITEEKVRAKAEELYRKEVPVRWLLMDDGWLSVRDSMLYDYIPEKEKFPTGFARMILDIKREGNISWFGVWHALGGYWGGIQPGSRLEQLERDHLYDSTGGRLLPSPQMERGFGFYKDWYAYLRQEGIDFVKVDGQSAVRSYFENSVPVCQAARGIHQALEGGASYLNGAVINCMGMAMENMLSRPSTALSRSSDDFVPARENGFGEHLLQNAYNALYQGQLYYCDWDMFWTSHPDASKHALLRAVSGGPVYVSDKIGETDPQVLSALTYLDGRLLLMDRPALPTEDCVFMDPMKEGVLKLSNTAACGGKKAGGIAAYNLTQTRHAYHFSPEDVQGLTADGTYVIYDYFHKTAQVCGGKDHIATELAAEGFAWYQILPFDGKAVFLGLTEKYAGFSAVEDMWFTEKGMMGILREQGPTGFVCTRIPDRVFCNGADVTDFVVKEEGSTQADVYIIALKPENTRAVLEVCWETQ